MWFRCTHSCILMFSQWFGQLVIQHQKPARLLLTADWSLVGWEAHSKVSHLSSFTSFLLLTRSSWKLPGHVYSFSVTRYVWRTYIWLFCLRFSWWNCWLICTQPKPQPQALKGLPISFSPSSPLLEDKALAFYLAPDPSWSLWEQSWLFGSRWKPHPYKTIT